MAGMMDLVLYGGLAIVGLNIVKPDILPDFLQIPQLQTLLSGIGGGGGDAGGGDAGGDTGGDPSAGDGKGGAGGGGGGKHGGGGSTGGRMGGGRHKRRGKHRQAAFARAYAVGYGQNFYG